MELNIKKVLSPKEKVEKTDESVVTETTEEIKPKELTASDINKQALEVGKVLAKQKKVTLYIPKDPLNPSDDIVPVCINGYKYKIKRGEEVEVPKVVKDILKVAGYLG